MPHDHSAVLLQFISYSDQKASTPTTTAMLLQFVSYSDHKATTPTTFAMLLQFVNVQRSKGPPTRLPCFRSRNVQRSKRDSDFTTSAVLPRCTPYNNHKVHQRQLCHALGTCIVRKQSARLPRDSSSSRICNTQAPFVPLSTIYLSVP